MTDAAPAPAHAQSRPTEIRIRRAARCLEIDFDDGLRAILPAEYLRVESPSAEVQGHGPAERKTIGGKQEVNIALVEPIGHYAVRIRFTDGHDTGIYSWVLLHELARQHDERWKSYLDRLAAQGLSREPKS